MEPRTLKSYTLAFKKRVLTRLEENSNNIAKTVREFATEKFATEKICNDGKTRKT